MHACNALHLRSRGTDLHLLILEASVGGLLPATSADPAASGCRVSNAILHSRAVHLHDGDGRRLALTASTTTACASPTVSVRTAASLPVLHMRRARISTPTFALRAPGMRAPMLGAEVAPGHFRSLARPSVRCWPQALPGFAHRPPPPPSTNASTRVAVGGLGKDLV